MAEDRSGNVSARLVTVGVGVFAGIRRLLGRSRVGGGSVEVTLTLTAPRGRVLDRSQRDLDPRASTSGSAAEALARAAPDGIRPIRSVISVRRV